MRQTIVHADDASMATFGENQLCPATRRTSGETCRARAAVAAVGRPDA
jgi:hypothetical protein